MSNRTQPYSIRTRRSGGRIRTQGNRSRVSRSDIRGERIEVTSTAEATIEFNLRNSANTANTEVIGSMAEVNRPAAVTLTPTLERNGPPDWTQSAEIPNFNSDTHVPATQTDGVVRPLIPFHYSDDVSDEDARQSVIVPAVAVAPAVNTRSRDQEAANESVIILSDDEEDDEIVCITTKVNPAYRHRRIPRRPPLLLELPDSPPPPPPPAPVVVPTPAPEPTGVIRRCPVCMDTLDEISADPNRRLRVTKCGHIFCEKCIVDSLKHQKMCPLCKTKIASIKSCVSVFW